MILPKETVLVFDFDGTIVETEKQVVGIMNDLRARVGMHPISMDTFRKTGSGVGILHYKFARFLSSFVVRFVQAKQAKDLNRMTVEPGLLRVIRELYSHHYKMGIITSNSLDNVQHYLRYHHLSELFDFVYVSDGLFDKGDAIKKMIVEHRLNSSEIIYVGDETRDVEAAKNAGVRVAAVTWGYQSRDAFLNTHPDWLVDKPTQLLHLFVPSPWWKRLFLKLFSSPEL